MKKALAGPPKRTAKKLPERRAMIAAARRRIGAVLSAAAKGTRRLDRAAANRIEKLRPVLARRLRWLRERGKRVVVALGRRLRPVGVLVLRAFAKAERWLRRASATATRGATRASAIVTPRRAVYAVVLASAACLAISQFVSYRGVEIGQPGYVGLSAAAPPTEGIKTAGETSAYVLVGIALLAAVAATLALRPARRGLSRVVVALGLLSIAVILIVDLPAGLDAGAQASRFSGANAVLFAGFYAQLAAAAGLVIGGLLYYARPCRIRINLSGRAASARRRRRRPPDSSRDRAARRPLRRRNGAASAPASRP
jgi:hypothetical protein